MQYRTKHIAYRSAEMPRPSATSAEGKHMKIDFQNLNIQPYPNPKPLAVERVSVRISQGEGHTEQHSQMETGYIRNAKLHPDAHTGRR